MAASHQTIEVNDREPSCTPAKIRVCRQINRGRRAMAMFATLLVVAMSGGATPATKPTTQSTAKPPAVATPAPGRHGTPASLTTAMKALATEYEAAMKQNADLPRATSDYFSNKLPDDATADDVLALITRSMNGSASESAYIKWQLLSAVPGVAEGAVVQKIQTAYVNAPKPLAAFSSDLQTRAMLDRALVGKTPDQEGNLETGFEKLAAPTVRANLPILAYRYELLTRMPPSAGAMLAQVDDFSARFTAGVMTSADYTALQTSIQGWVATGPDANSVSAVQKAIRGMKSLKGPVAYSGSIMDDPNGKNLTWKRVPAEMDAVRVSELAKILSNVQGTGGGDGLKFKN